MGKLSRQSGDDQSDESDSEKDELDLGVGFQDLEIPPHILFPEQLNRHFRDQIYALNSENGLLRRGLDETEAKLKDAQEQLNAKKDVPVIGRASEMAASKIASLSKKVREQTAEMEGLKSRLKDAEGRLRLREESKEEEVEKDPRPGSPGELAERNRAVKALQEKLQASNVKMCDFRNQCQALRNDLKMAQKVIECEVGEKASLAELTKDGSNWRGRAQQIIALQNKVQVLQEQLGGNGVECPANNVLRQMERERRASHEETNRLLSQRTMQVEETRMKMEGARARNKVLEGDIVQLKSKIATLLDKTTRDEQTTRVLQGEVIVNEERLKEQSALVSRLQENLLRAQREVALGNTQNEQIQAVLRDREKRIQRLVAKIEEGAPHKTESQPGVDKSASTEDFHEVEKLRLAEFTEVLGRRLEAARADRDEAEAGLRRERARAARLETKVGRLELERLGALKCGRGSYSGKGSEVIVLDEEQMARHQIEYLQEECLALRTRMQTLQMEKNEDAQRFASILKEIDKGKRSKLNSKRESVFGVRSESTSSSFASSKRSKCNKTKTPSPVSVKADNILYESPRNFQINL